MLYRDWEYKDILEISQLEENCFQKEAWSYRMFADSFSMANFYGVCVEDNQAIVGYVCITLAGEQVDLCTIAVAEHYRNQGIAKSLLKKMINYAKQKGAKKMFLEVRVSNAPAQMLYLKEGFKGIHTRSRYYPDGEDAVIMAKEL